MPIVKILAKQKIDMQLTAVLGQGKKHIKWAPGTAFYRKEPVVKLGSVKDPQGIMDKCTDGLFELKGNKLSVVKENAYDSNLLEFYAELDKEIKVEYTDNIIFDLESWGQLSFKEILQAAGDILLEKIEAFEKALEA